MNGSFSPHLRSAACQSAKKSLPFKFGNSKDSPGSGNSEAASGKSREGYLDSHKQQSTFHYPLKYQ